MRTKSRFLSSGIYFFMILVCLYQTSIAENLLLDNPNFSKQYLIELNGNAKSEVFSGVQALLTISYPTPLSNNSYLIIIQGFPETNARNSFYWNSDQSEMMDTANHITCTIRKTLTKATDIHFFFLSPIFLKNRIFVTQHEEEDIRIAESMALPTRVNAQSGELDLRIHSNFVSGTVQMKGYDPVEKAYVQYSADIIGKRSYNLESRIPFRK